MLLTSIFELRMIYLNVYLAALKQIFIRNKMILKF